MGRFSHIAKNMNANLEAEKHRTTSIEYRNLGKRKAHVMSKNAAYSRAVSKKREPMPAKRGANEGGGARSTHTWKRGVGKMRTSQSCGPPRGAINTHGASSKKSSAARASSSSSSSTKLMGRSATERHQSTNTNKTSSSVVGANGDQMRFFGVGGPSSRRPTNAVGKAVGAKKMALTKRSSISAKPRRVAPSMQFKRSSSAFRPA
uniref:Uncharacterized protein n=1 Tax=Octactis speculum TaxID=3111310 RepID=A0A7S2D270_9STRA|mmetsp:Transcript_4247/g.5002  ORF Transcript_4247/g.5002 Transcript_4247/m.5002 type:complete len:205 (+) Transcript_4247:23-637(+)